METWEYKSIGTSEIFYGFDNPKASVKAASIYSGTTEETKRKWNELVNKAKGYEYGEQQGFKEYTHFPHSTYPSLGQGTNSNTFVRTMVRETGLSALIATHNLELAGRMDRIVRLDQGRVI